MRSKVFVFLLLFSVLLLAMRPEKDLQHKKLVLVQNVFKYNWNFTDSTKVYHDERDSSGKILEKEGTMPFNLPPQSASDFEWALANAYDKDTVLLVYQNDHVCRVGSADCAEFVMSYGSNHKPDTVFQYGCTLAGKKPHGSKLLLNKAVLSYAEDGLHTSMGVVENDGHVSERLTWFYDKEGRGIMDQWEIPTQNFYYRVYYSSMYR